MLKLEGGATYPYTSHQEKRTIVKRRDGSSVKYPWLISQPNGNEVKLSDEQATVIAQYILTVVQEQEEA